MKHHWIFLQTQNGRYKKSLQQKMAAKVDLAVLASPGPIAVLRFQVLIADPKEAVIEVRGTV